MKLIMFDEVNSSESKTGAMGLKLQRVINNMDYTTVVGTVIALT